MYIKKKSSMQFYIFCYCFGGLYFAFNGFLLHLIDSEGKNSRPCFLSDIKLELALENTLMHLYNVCM